MSLDRRTFLRRLVLGGAAFSVANTLDPEFWSWVPGAKTILEVPALVMPTYAEVMTFGLFAGPDGNIWKAPPLESPVLKQFGLARSFVVPNSSLRIAGPNDSAMGLRKWDGKLVTLVDGPAPEPFDPAKSSMYANSIAMLEK